jgi:hypothetical protein
MKYLAVPYRKGFSVSFSIYAAKLPGERLTYVWTFVTFKNYQINFISRLMCQTNKTGLEVKLKSYFGFLSCQQSKKSREEKNKEENLNEKTNWKTHA